MYQGKKNVQIIFVFALYKFRNLTILVLIRLLFFFNANFLFLYAKIYLV